MKCPSCGAEASGKFCSTCGAALGGAHCPSCNAQLTPGARFCHVCGSPLGTPRGSAARANVVPWIVAGTAVALLVVVFVARSGSPSSSIVQGGGRGGASPPIPAPSGGMATTDLSQMTPREQADRLFNRIMTASENGNTNEVSFFGPMALQAYANLGRLDPDARYHVGLIAATIGNEAGAAAQADSLEKNAPRHLFVPLLRWEVANRRKDGPAMRRAYRQFLDNYDQEMASGKSEYNEHRTRLESFRTEAQGAVGRASS